MEVTKQHIADKLRQAGYAAVADEVTRELPDRVDLDHAATLLQRYGITKDSMISQMGGSPLGSGRSQLADRLRAAPAPPRLSR
jgi:hypothetical protein